MERSTKILNAQGPLPTPAILELLYTQLKLFNMTFPICVSASPSSGTPVGSIPLSQCLYHFNLTSLGESFFWGSVSDHYFNTVKIPHF